MPITADGIRKTLTPSLARVVAASTLFVAVIGALVLAWKVHSDLTVGVHRIAQQDLQVSYVDGSRRMVRSAVQPGSLIVCSEGPRQLQYFASRPKNDTAAEAVPSAVTSAVYLREAGWQLCNAYANGALSKEKYVDLLATVISDSQAKSGSASPKQGRRQRRRQLKKVTA